MMISTRPGNLRDVGQPLPKAKNDMHDLVMHDLTQKECCEYLAELLSEI